MSQPRRRRPIYPILGVGRWVFKVTTSYIRGFSVSVLKHPLSVPYNDDMRITLPTQPTLATKPSEFLDTFCEALGPEARDVLTPEVLLALAISDDATVSDALRVWKRPYESMQVLRSHHDLSPDEVAATMIELRREPHGELAHSIAENPHAGPDLD